jgi:hypothetical protein
MHAPIRIGAHLAANCSETEQFGGDRQEFGEIWILDCLIYDHRERGREKTRAGHEKEETAEQPFREDRKCLAAGASRVRG